MTVRRLTTEMSPVSAVPSASNASSTLDKRVKDDMPQSSALTIK